MLKASHVVGLQEISLKYPRIEDEYKNINTGYISAVTSGREGTQERYRKEKEKQALLTEIKIYSDDPEWLINYKVKRGVKLKDLGCSYLVIADALGVSNYKLNLYMSKLGLTKPSSTNKRKENQ